MTAVSAPGEEGGRRGRRASGADTRGEILAAARVEFAERGFDNASLRGIARRAGVDPALVHHYFAGKESLFAAALNFVVDPATEIPALLSGPREELGERVVRFLLRVWETPEGRQPFVAMLRSATTSEAGARMLREFVTRAVLARLLDRIDVPDRELRATITAAQLVGVAILRYVVRVEPLASVPEQDIVDLVAPTIQRYLTGSPGP